MANKRSVGLDLLTSPPCRRDLLVQRREAPFFGFVELRLHADGRDVRPFSMLDMNDDYVVQSFSPSDAYEPLMAYEWLRMLRHCRYGVLDVGASSGFYALLTTMGNPQLEVHAFEPFSRAYARLIENKLLNGAARIKIHPYAVGDTDGMVDFRVKSIEGPITTAGQVHSAETEHWPSLPVPMRRIEALVPASLPLELIKLDVEGYEAVVLRSIEARIQRDRPCIFFEAQHAQGLEEVRQLLLTLGYQVACLEEETKCLRIVHAAQDGVPERNFVAYLPEHGSRFGHAPQ